MNSKLKMLIESQNAVGTEIASELSANGIYAVTRHDFSVGMLEKNDAVLIDNTGNDIDESLETSVLSGKMGIKTFILTSDVKPLIYVRNGVLFISQNLGTESIGELIRYCLGVGNPHRQTEKCVSKVLMELGVQTNLKGYRYLTEAVLLNVVNPELSYNFNHGVYPVIAKNHGTTPASVERAVRNSIELAYDRNYRKFEEFFGYPLQKPTNTEFISFCAEKIRLELF